VNSLVGPGLWSLRGLVKIGLSRGGYLIGELRSPKNLGGSPVPFRPRYSIIFAPGGSVYCSSSVPLPEDGGIISGDSALGGSS
jgi:hypothetical protein